MSTEPALRKSVSNGLEENANKTSVQSGQKREGMKHNRLVLIGDY